MTLEIIPIGAAILFLFILFSPFGKREVTTNDKETEETTKDAED